MILISRNQFGTRHERLTLTRVILLFVYAVATAAAAPPDLLAADPTSSPTATAPATNVFENSLGMKFVAVPGLKVRFSVWETRVKDYQAFISATDRVWTAPGFAQEPTHPAVNVNWEDASAFCFWLTGKERKEGRLAGKQRYRLPSDHEWGIAVGLGTEQGKTPEDRMKTQIVWCWGHYWPPLMDDGNFGQELAVDTFAHTAPAGSFKPNTRNLFDLGGNVWEWCEDWYNDAHVTKALRGGSFNDAQPVYLLANYRFSGTMNLTSDDIGFRIVLEGFDKDL